MYSVGGSGWFLTVRLWVTVVLNVMDNVGKSRAKMEAFFFRLTCLFLLELCVMSLETRTRRHLRSSTAHRRRRWHPVLRGWSWHGLKNVLFRRPNRPFCLPITCIFLLCDRCIFNDCDLVKAMVPSNLSSQANKISYKEPRFGIRALCHWQERRKDFFQGVAERIFPGDQRCKISFSNFKIQNTVYQISKWKCQNSKSRGTKAPATRLDPHGHQPFRLASCGQQGQHFRHDSL